MSRPYPCPRLGPGKCCTAQFCPEFCKMTDRELIQCLPRAQEHLRQCCETVGAVVARNPSDRKAVIALSVYRQLHRASLTVNALDRLMAEGFCVFCFCLVNACECCYRRNPLPRPSS
ncbi:hypothetical protein PTSG_05015 [Salpingoeca rosetta]|uniref:Uncharacterized protein n=1 Tax=Salpingoeca rosetta (strain ATCC 50818 / BSB-021) TaxID=946362 RepID=F2U995_SALR5|nr:uncharacterized protein PTSG_05015 [Salpingoeca rosetta]EGD73298.1 hypothetical protein PTSG_05015 [Salpingoeca rosetta]|eukprot:XP_004994329.1 hypothetical protein PTSG_05015 [Salpingoeca rosetta]